MKPKIKVAFASGTDELNARLIERMRGIFPHLPLYVVSEFPPEGDLKWVRYEGGLFRNLARSRAAFRGKSIRLAGVLLVPNVPFRRMRLLAFLLAPLYFLAVNENLNEFMLRPGSLPVIARYLIWRASNFVRYHFSRQGPLARRDWARDFRNAATRAAGWLGFRSRTAPGLAEEYPVAVFSGRPPSGKPVVLIASPYVPFPLSHGGAVRMYNLMRHTAREFDLVLLAFAEAPEAPAPELLAICVEVILVQRIGRHSHPSRGRPDVVEDFAAPAFRAALRDAVRRWHPGVAQLEFTQMAQYAADCAPARTILVEHDVTIDLYAQLLEQNEDWDLRRQLKLWRRFETKAWHKVDRVVTMSEKDRAMIRGGRAVVLPNGVDLERFRPSASEPEPGSLLFIGSFAHLPNLMAAEFFLKRVWPHLAGASLHIIAGARHEYFLERYRSQTTLDFDQPGVEVSGFVSDVRSAYERAAVVVAPLPASAGTNIKILEAMAMGKAIVSTPAGVNGLDVTPGEEFVLVRDDIEMAHAIAWLLAEPSERRRLEAAARRRAEQYGWERIAQAQAELYRDLCGGS